MVKKIAFARIIQRLTNKFKLLDSRAEEFLLSETIVPVTDVDALLRQTKDQQTSTPNGTARTDTYTVPTNKRWKPISARMERGVAGGMYIAVTFAESGRTIALVNFGAVSVGYLNTALNNLEINAGDSLSLVFETALTGTLVSNLIYLEEDAY